MTHNHYIYIAVMALVSYAIRILPLTLIRKPIKNRFIQSFLYYVPYGHCCKMREPTKPPAPVIRIFFMIISSCSAMKKCPAA